MAGHSKWKNIKHKKAKVDAQRGKIFTKIGKEIIIAVKQGGTDQDINIRLRNAIQKAKENNMPNDNIKRVIQKASGELAGVNYEEIVYEGYGPGGVAVLLNIMTDNRNRVAAEIRHLFSKNNGNLGESGCVAWIFEHKGLISSDKKHTDLDDDEIMLIALESGAEDVTVEDDDIEIVTSPEDYESVKEGLKENSLDYNEAELTMLPSNTVNLEGKEANRMLKLMEALEDHDDVQNVYANFDISDEEMANL